MVIVWMILFIILLDFLKIFLFGFWGHGWGLVYGRGEV
jgi:hypothetical protein